MVDPFEDLPVEVTGSKSGVRLGISDMPILFMLSIYFLSYIPLWFSVVFNVCLGQNTSALKH